MANDSQPQYRDMSVRRLLQFFDENPQVDEYTWVNGSKVRFSDVLRKAQKEIEDVEETWVHD